MVFHLRAKRGLFWSGFCVASCLGFITSVARTARMFFLGMPFNSNANQQPTYYHQPQSLLSITNLQECIDAYTSRGYWEKNQWTLPQSYTDGETTMANTDDNNEYYSHCQFQEQLLHLTNAQILQTLSSVTIGFMGDSTTRSDIRAYEETFGWTRTNLDEAQVFQRKDKNGTYVCALNEQSFNLTKCGIPPIVETHNIRYFYKVYPWSPLDEWYFREEQHHLFHDLDVLVISIGRWLIHRSESSEEIATLMSTFLTKLRQIFNGTILYQSEYGSHTMDDEIIQSDPKLQALQIQHNCSHGLMNRQFDCLQTTPETRPPHDLVIRSVVTSKSHSILYLDRWNISQTLPLEHYQSWLCGKPSFHSWFCDHHLGFVAMQHFRLLAYVVHQIKSNGTVV
mmetsp:Transcript_8291/g.11818  ORF Transcript_8291/g.11818 Transcript_8291/m.11818 type:complete len:395 (-) Transcript_8291:230-1414(-)